MSGHQDTTRKPVAETEASGEREIAALTVACHPDLRRIGERALLPELTAGHAVRLSRLEPDFTSTGAAWGRPLDDPYLSRKPVVLRPGAQGEIVLDPAGTSIEVRVDGRRLGAEGRVSGAEIAAGLVMELAGRIVLVLHRLPESVAEEQEPDGKMAGASAPMLRVRAAIGRVADLEVPVLLRGESGTGKELAARALHRRGGRAAGRFVAVNLGALPPSLAAAELFGSVKGAFTGAVASQTGYFRAAEGGTLFLDEVGETPAEVQAMLLRTLETGEVLPLGSQRAHRVSARLIAATDADLESRVRAGSFKEPLLHRLAAYEIWLPPLRQRRDDIGRLFLRFAQEELAALGDEERLTSFEPEAAPWLPAGLAARLLRLTWPGNVRQLRNVVRQLMIDNRGRAQLAAGSRVERLLAASAVEGAEGASSESLPGVGPGVPERRRPAEIGMEELAAALRQHRFEPAAAAAALGITRPSIYYLIAQHPTLRTAGDLDEETVRRAVEKHDGNVAAAARELEVSVRALRRRWKRPG